VGADSVVWLMTGTSMDSCEQGKLNVTSGSIKRKEFLGKVSYYDLLKKDSVP
jgi:hypothetical protein